MATMLRPIGYCLRLESIGRFLYELAAALRATRTNERTADLSPNQVASGVGSALNLAACLLARPRNNRVKYESQSVRVLFYGWLILMPDFWPSQSVFVFVARSLVH